jgi:activator of HSP90 ATPase
MLLKLKKLFINRSKIKYWSKSKKYFNLNNKNNFDSDFSNLFILIKKKGK